MSKRPVGVVVAAVLLGLAAAVALLMSLGSMVAALGGPQIAGSLSTAGAPAVRTGVLTATMLFMALMYLGLAGWMVFTLAGLLRLRPWARISAMVIGGCVAAFALLGAVSMFAVGSMVRSGALPTQTSLDPAMLHTVLAGMAAFFLLVAFAGIAAVVYFALRRVRECFAVVGAGLPSGTSYPPASYVAPLSARQASPRPVASQPPLSPADFGVAQPVQAPVSGLSAFDALPATPQLATEPPPAFRQPLAGRPRGRPAVVTILAVLLFLATFGGLLGLVSTVPLFLFGFALRGPLAHLVSLLLAILAGICGLGLLRLQRPALQLTFVLLALYALNGLAFLLPYARVHFSSYYASVVQAGNLGQPTPAMPAGFLNIMATFSGIVTVALAALAASLLWRSRAAFGPTPVSPAETTTSEL